MLQNRDEKFSVFFVRKRLTNVVKNATAPDQEAGKRIFLADRGYADTLKLRVLKFPISKDSYEYIVTNLPAYAFSMPTIKSLYNLRWNKETAFRHLKYAGNMVHIHSLKKEFYIQEIFGKLTMYNFASFLAQTVSTEQTDCNKYTYNLNHTQLQKICIRFLKGIIEDVSPLIQRFLVPVRPDRKFERNLRRQSADTLGYR